ncbi:response regulator transcription factor [Pseudomonas sp. 5P_3.1_Bac2]|uniref:response regulator transcription factor n=1 Tax=Pseudomonas sp. 5P_3.1_Bac2 TaxID=2971617 RepID=UPI0021C681DD|nr:response regulator transcription factor [Pseudomonas sp. 5P_3.1_Bac2]MCU1719456.1 response regulator transcription factor [Pseudomonas sp. 5P_3.1_Bac2]
MAQILIADDHAVVRMAVRMLLENAGHQVVGEADCGVDVIGLVRNLKPQLIILDIDLPKLDGFAVLQRLCDAEDAPKVLVFSGMAADQYAVRCSRAGASGFVSKDDDLDGLLTAVKIILAGYTLFPTIQLSQSTSSVPTHSSVEQDAIKHLSSREITVLRHLARGQRVRDIAKTLLLSEKTISTYKSRLITKLQVSNLAELIEIAKRNSII